jgi:hypothetical protein
MPPFSVNLYPKRSARSILLFKVTYFPKTVEANAQMQTQKTKRDMNQTFVLSLCSQVATETVTSSRNMKMGSQPNFFQGIEILNLPMAPGTSHIPDDIMTHVMTRAKLSTTMQINLNIHVEI